MKISKKFKVVASKLLAVALIGSTVVGAASPVFAEGTGTYTRSITIKNQFDNGGAKDGITGGKYTITPYKVVKSDNTVSTDQAEVKEVLKGIATDTDNGITVDGDKIILDFNGKSSMKLDLYTRTPEKPNEYAFKIEQIEGVPGFIKNKVDVPTVEFPNREPSNDGKLGDFTLRNENIEVNFKNTLQAGTDKNGGALEFGFTKLSNRNSSVEGTMFALKRIDSGNKELEDNVRAYYNGDNMPNIEVSADANGKVKIDGVVPGKYELYETSADTNKNHFRITEKVATIDVDDNLIATFVDKIDKFSSKNNSFDFTSNLTNYARPKQDADTENIDGAFNKTLYAVNGKEVGNKAAKDITVRKGDKLEWKLSVNIPDNIKDFKKFGISDSVGDGLVFKDPKKENEEPAATDFVREIVPDGKKALFDEIRFDNGDLVLEIKDPSTVTETGAVDVIVTTYVKNEVESTNKVNNIMRVLYKTDDVTSGYNDDGKYNPGASDPDDKYDTGDNSPKVDTQSQLIVKTDDKQSTVRILDEKGKEEFKSKEPNSTTDINNLPDGKHIVEITTEKGSDKEDYRPVKSKIEIVIKNGEVTEVDGKPVENFTNENGITWDDNTNTLGIKMLDVDTWVPGTGTLTVIPLIGLAGAAAIAGKAARNKENKEEEE